MLSKITKVLCVVAVGTSLLSLTLNYLNVVEIYNSNWFVSVLFFLSVAFLINFILLRKEIDPKELVLKIMVTSMLRIVIYMAGIFVYRLVDKANFTSFVVHFMMHYVLFTVFEIAYLLKFTKSQNLRP